ncbi:MAG: enoyl-CoA hydratase/isomerase family protein [Acidimicrobiales bacterium]
MAEGSGFVRIERGGDGVAVLRIDRPRANALSTEVVRQIMVAAEELTEDPPGAVVVWGGRLLFAAGADITELTTDDGVVISAAEAVAISDGFRAAYDAVAAIPRLTVAAISGYALGGGCELALACDLRVCADNAKLGQPEILLGIIPGGGGTQRLARLVGPARAKDLILTGRLVGAEEALRIGLVDRVVDRGDVLTAATALAAEAAAGALVAQALAKRAVDDGLEMTLDDGLTLEAELFGQAFRTADAATGVRSFLAHGPGQATFEGR